MSVIVTNARNRVCYAVVRSLGSKGIKVYTSDTGKSAMCFYSKYSIDHFIYPSPFSRPNEFIDDLIKQIKRVDCKVLIPVYEETFLISKYQKELSAHVNLVVPDYESILTLHNKDRLYKLAEGVGIKVPKTFPVVELKGDPTLIQTLRFPVLLKPCQGGGAWGQIRVPTAAQLKHMLDTDSFPFELLRNRWLVQEIIEGDVYCCAMLFNKGSFRAGHCYRQLRQTPITGGTATYRESINDFNLVSNLKRLLEHMQWHGICQADFIKDKETGDFSLIDANPRLYGSLSLSIASGVDFPYMLYRLAQEGDIDPVFTYKTGVTSRWLFGDVKCFFESLRSSAGLKDFHGLNFFKFKKGEVLDELDLRDPLPMLAWIKDYLGKFLFSPKKSAVTDHALDGIWE